jgi:hypothetical protein
MHLSRRTGKDRRHGPAVLNAIPTVAAVQHSDKKFQRIQAAVCTNCGQRWGNLLNLIIHPIDTNCRFLSLIRPTLCLTEVGPLTAAQANELCGTVKAAGGRCVTEYE